MIGPAEIEEMMAVYAEATDRRCNDDPGGAPAWLPTKVPKESQTQRIATA
jgi:hypothetical protein